MATVQINDGSAGRKKSLKNLRPYKPGQSGNPAGRPPGIRDRRSLKPWLLKTLDATDPNGTTLWEMVAQALVVGAAKGDVRAAEFVRDTIEGKPGPAAGEDPRGGRPPITLKVLNILGELPLDMLKRLEEATLEAEGVGDGP